MFRVHNEAGTLAAWAVGAGPPLIYAHGLTGNHEQALAQLAPLQSQWGMIVYDQRGHGQSTPVLEPRYYAAPALAADIASVLDALGIERAVVGGTSMGAAAALLFALRWPARVDHLILTAPAFGHRPHPARGELKQIARDIRNLGLPAYVDLMVTDVWPTQGWTSAAIERRASSLRLQDPNSLAVACETVADWVILPYLTVLAELRMPTTVVAWDGDAIHPLALTREIAASIPGAELRLIKPLDYYNQPEIVGRICAERLEGTLSCVRRAPQCVRQALHD